MLGKQRKECAEGEGPQRLFKKRRDGLDAHNTNRDPEVTTLGMLTIANAGQTTA